VQQGVHGRQVGQCHGLREGDNKLRVAAGAGQAAKAEVTPPTSPAPACKGVQPERGCGGGVASGRAAERVNRAFECLHDLIALPLALSVGLFYPSIETPPTSEPTTSSSITTTRTTPAATKPVQLLKLEVAAEHAGALREKQCGGRVSFRANRELRANSTHLREKQCGRLVEQGPSPSSSSSKK
jgi:hypothetical protein